MSEQEKKVVEKLKEAIPKMNDFQKGYVLGMVEGSASVSKISQQKRLGTQKQKNRKQDIDSREICRNLQIKCVCNTGNQLIQLICDGGRK